VLIMWGRPRDTARKGPVEAQLEVTNSATSLGQPDASKRSARAVVPLMQTATGS